METFRQFVIQPVGRLVVMYLVTSFIMGVLYVLFRSRKIQPKGFRWRQIRNELFFVALNTFLSGILLGALTKLLHPYTAFNTEPAAWWVTALEYIAFFFLFDTYFYWFHRLMHIEPIYTCVHKIHHFSTSPGVLTTFSVNPLESLINGGFVPIFTAVLTIHQSTMPLIGLTTIFMGLYVHSGYEFLPRWWNKTWITKWFITATFHDEHHKYFRFNFGGFTPIWDYIAGTVRPRYEADFRPQRITESVSGTSESADSTPA